jgi:two-component system LytT family sensor kinase
VKIQNRHPVIHLNEALCFIAFYLFFAALYYTTLWFNNAGSPDQDPYFNLMNFLNRGGLDYFLKLILTLPICWLMFYLLVETKLATRLLIHCLTLPLFVLIWQKSYYWITEWFGMRHLTSTGQVWDLYIPALFYILQFGVLHAYVYFLQNQEKLQSEAMLKEAALKSELSALKAQLNPHFLYNVFNSINASIPSELESTRQMIAELSDMFRYQLQASKSEFVTLREELDFTRKYLDLEKIRFEERLQVEIVINEELMTELIPPMLIQPLVENAVKHGISALIQGGKVSILIEKRNEKIFFVIKDTGKGIINKIDIKNKGIGLTYTALRLEKMFGSEMELSDNEPTGLIVKFSIG